MSNQAPKIKGVADVVFLVDKTGSMSKAMNALVTGIGTLFDAMVSPSGQDVPPLTDWRAKVIGYGDVKADGEKWWKEAPFRAGDVAQVKADLVALQPVSGGGDDPESLLDALFKVATMGSTPEGVAPEAGKWREGRLHKVVVVFSDAPTHPQCDLPEASGADYMQVAARVGQAGIRVFLYVPSHESTYHFDTWPKLVFQPVGQYVPGTDEAVRAMEALATNREAFGELLTVLGKTISQGKPHQPPQLPTA